jgi:response regulator RpfG family c-di-GMP phosphodiesterase
MVATNRILVVDDEAVIRELLSDILTDDGYSVESAPSGPVALNLIRARDNFALLFTDIMMPEMDGIQLVREALKIRPSLIAIVMTGFASMETARAAVKEGAYDYVQKPFSLSEVKMAVSNAIERHRLAVENTRLLELTKILDICETMARIRDERELLHFVLHAALDQVGADRGSIMLTTPDGGALEVAASVGLPEEAAHTIVPMGRGISGRVARSGEPLLVKDLIEHPELRQESRQLAHRSFVSVPLMLKTRRKMALGELVPQTLAVMNICSKRDQEPFSEADLKMLGIVANHAAAALENVRGLREAESAQLDALRQLVYLSEAREGYTRGHCDRVREMSMLLARELGMPSGHVAALELVSPVHDIGRIGVPQQVLAKSGPLSDDEWRVVRRHPITGVNVLGSAAMLKPIHLDVVRHHHERFDGGGYPDGLRGDEIPPLARVMALSDAYVAMGSPRPHRAAMTTLQIAEEIRSNRGGQFDPTFSDVALQLIENGAIQ